MMVGQPSEKSQNFLPSAKRLLGIMRPSGCSCGRRWRSPSCRSSSVPSVPKILGRATDLIFAGLFGRQIPQGMTVAQYGEALRATVRGKVASMLGRWPTSCRDRGRLRCRRPRVLLLALGLYAASSLLGWAQARIIVEVVNRSVYRLRRDVEEKLSRLPLSHFDSPAAGSC